MRMNRVFVAVALCAGAGIAGCQSASHAVGLGKVSPDEFRVVTKAPGANARSRRQAWMAATAHRSGIWLSDAGARADAMLAVSCRS